MKGHEADRALHALHGERLYAILDVALTRARGYAPLAVLDAWLDAGVRVVQLRAKVLPTSEFLDLADAGVARCRCAGAVFIINDRADVACMVQADGVHIGQDDLAPGDVRAVAGAGAIVGRSSHTSDEVRRALDEAIDYLAVGAIFPTSTKGEGHPVPGLALVRDAAARAAARGLPIVGIGGIRLDRAASVIEAGASAVAVISDLLADDPAARARSYLRALE